MSKYRLVPTANDDFSLQKLPEGKALAGALEHDWYHIKFVISEEQGRNAVRGIKRGIIYIEDDEEGCDADK